MTVVLCVGHAVQDYVFRTPQLPQRAEKHRATGFFTQGGGPAATAAVTVARLGGEARLVTRVGADPVADVLQQELERYGVDCRYLRRFSGHGSSVSSVFIDDHGERLIVNHTDPQMPTDCAWLDETVSFDDVSAVLADTRWSAGAVWVLRSARERGLPAVLDADTPVTSSSGLLEAATHLAFSLPGLRDIDASATDRQSAGMALQRLAQRYQAWCCVTLGAEGVLIADGRSSPAKPVGVAGALQHVAACTVTAVDTLGAGDVWHGAFALALAEGLDEFAAVRAASATAALKVSRFGGRAAVPMRAERDQFMETR
ncbi:MAG: sugar kinase [Sinobacteraceae bacterium]|nr:sugar kinase [Nevskiaceae bacterium]